MKGIESMHGLTIASWISLFLLLGCGLIYGDAGKQPNIPLGVDSIHASNDLCLMIGARAVSGEFFRGIQTKRKNGEPVYRKKGKVITVFPRRLTVYIDAGFDRCTGPGPKDCDRCDFRFSASFMDSLRFEAYWKHGFDTQKAELGVLSTEKSNDLSRLAPNAELWKYALSIESENVPLTDSLVIIVLSPDGRVVSRLSGKL